MPAARRSVQLEGSSDWCNDAAGKVTIAPLLPDVYRQTQGWYKDAKSFQAATPVRITAGAPPAASISTWRAESVHSGQQGAVNPLSVAKWLEMHNSGGPPGTGLACGADH